MIIDNVNLNLKIMKKLIILFVVITLVSAFTVGCTIYDDEQIQEQALDENGNDNGDDNPNSTIEYTSLIADETTLPTRDNLNTWKHKSVTIEVSF